jgi:hypothetical protein
MNNFDDKYRARATPTLEEVHLLLDGRRYLHLFRASSVEPMYRHPDISFRNVALLSSLTTTSLSTTSLSTASF